MSAWTRSTNLALLALFLASCANTPSEPLYQMTAATPDGVLFDPASPCQNFQQLSPPGPNRYKFSFTGSARVGEVVECSYYIPREVVQVVSGNASNPVTASWKVLGDKRTFYVQFGFSGFSGGSASTLFTIDLLLSAAAPPPRPPKPPPPPPPKPLKECVWLLGPEDGWTIAPLTTTVGCSRRPQYTVLIDWGSQRMAYSIDARSRSIKVRGSSTPTIADVTPIRSGLGSPVDTSLVSCAIDQRTYVCTNRSSRWVHLSYEISPNYDGIVFHELLAPDGRFVHPHFPPQITFKPLRLEYEPE